MMDKRKKTIRISRQSKRSSSLQHCTAFRKQEETPNFASKKENEYSLTNLGLRNQFRSTSPKIILNETTSAK